MATIRISFDGGNVPIVIGDEPEDEQTPIANPQPTGFMTNHFFPLPEGVYCFGLQTAQAYRPLWQVVQAVEGEQTDIAFRKSP